MITTRNLDTQAATSVTSIVSDSITPAANTLLLATVAQRTNITADPNAPTLTGNGLTWVQVNTVVYDDSSASRKRVSVFRAMGASPSSGAVTADFAGQSHTDATISIDEFSGIDTSGTNGSGAIVQSVVDKWTDTSHSTLSITLAAFGSGANATFGGFGMFGSATSTPGSGFLELFDFITGGTLSSTGIFKEVPDTTVDITASATGELGGVAIEIKSAALVLPVQSEITTMNYSSRGLPFVDVPASSSIDVQTMDYVSRGLPFVPNPFPTSAPSPATLQVLMMMGVGV